MGQVQAQQERSCRVQIGNRYRSEQQCCHRSRRASSNYPVANCHRLCCRCSHHRYHRLSPLHSCLQMWVCPALVHRLRCLALQVWYQSLRYRRCWCNHRQRHFGTQHRSDLGYFHTIRMKSNKYRGKRCYLGHTSGHHCWVRTCRLARDLDQRGPSGRHHSMAFAGMTGGRGRRGSPREGNCAFFQNRRFKYLGTLNSRSIFLANLSSKTACDALFGSVAIGVAT